MGAKLSQDVSKLIKKTLIPHVEYEITSAAPMTGIIYVINNFISGQIRGRGNTNGSYPYRYLQMIESVFGKAENCLEMCSGTVKPDKNTTTADIRMHDNDDDVDIVDDCQYLKNVPDDRFDRVRMDPPYNKRTAKEMYGCELPNTMKLLKTAARVVTKGSLVFLLSAQNYQWSPKSLKRVGCILMTVVPVNEIRAINIFLKVGDS